MAPIAFVIAGQEGLIHAIVMLWAGVLLCAAIYVAAYLVRRMVFDKNTKHSTGFTMEQIDNLHDNGTLTEEEYRLARRSILGLNEPDTPEQ